MAKVDLKKTLRDLYNASAKAPAWVEVGTLHYLMVDGQGDPNTSPPFQEAVQALYGVAFTMKFMCKGDDSVPEWVVMPLEGLWRTEDIRDFDPARKDAWKWTLMIVQPEFVTRTHVEQAVKELREKKNPPALSRLRFEPLEEGACAQLLHVGPYDEEGPTIERLHRFIEENGYALRGKHHEIYMSDPRRTAPERLKTILRQPVSAASGRVG